MAKKKGKKKAAKRKQTIDLTLRLNVELAQNGQQKQAPGAEARLHSFFGLRSAASQCPHAPRL